MKGILFLVGFIFGIILGVEAEGNSTKEKIENILDLIKGAVFKNYKLKKIRKKYKKKYRGYRNYIKNKN